MISIDEIVDLSLRLLNRVKQAEDRVKELEIEIEELKRQRLASGMQNKGT